MTLQPGAQLGPYEIQGLIGRGGMGEVYRATDTRLHRPVAIKVLPEELTSSASALDRLQREAQTASILNHPNICTIYDVGITNPAFIAMELLEGVSLQHRLSRGPVDTHSLLDIAVATADGLDAAHGHGFIHRDIKPANIFLTSHGPKLLDFGLAKAHAGTLAGAWSNDQTRPAEALLTEAGVTVGTVAYMSPEQLHGKDVDARTDVFSLGLVLYEMATGRPAFSGATSAAIAGAILYEQPIPPIDIVPTIPSRLNDIVLKAIEKDREDRYQTAADLRTDLRRLRRELDSHPSQSTTLVTGGRQGSESASAHVSSDTRAGQSTRRFSFGLIAAALVVAAVAAIAVYVRPWASTTPAMPSPISIANVQVSRLTTTGDAVRAAIAPDGNYFAYVRRQKGLHSLHVRQTATAATAEIVKAETEVTLWGATVSPDSGFVDYVRRRQGQTFELWRVPFLGGASTRLLDRVNSPIGWSPDGRRFAFVRAEAPGTTFVVIANADGSGERLLAERQRPAQFVSLMIATRPSIAPTWSPNGRLLAVAGAGVGTDPDGGDVAIIDVDSGELRTIALPTTAVRGLVWFDESMLLLNAAIGSGSLQLHQLTYPSGELSPLTRDVNDYDGISLAGDRQTLVGSRREQQTDLAILDGAGRTLTTGPNLTARSPTTVNWTGDRVLYSNWAWTPGSQPKQLLFDNAAETTASPDGRTIVFTRGNVLWKANRDGGVATMLVTGDAAHPVVTPDNRSVIFVSGRSGQQSLWMIPLDGGEPRQLVSQFAAAPGVDISPDGQAMLFPSRDDERKIGVVFICNLADCRPREVLPGTVSTRFRWTPNGRAIAFIEGAARTNIYTVPVAGGPPLN